MSVGITSTATTPGNGAQVADRIGLLRDSMQTALCSVDSPLSLEERAVCFDFFGLMERLATDADADRAAVAKSVAYAL